MLILGFGATTPVGRTAWSAAAAVRAGVSGFAKHEFMVDSEGAPMHVASFPWIEAVQPADVRLRDALVAAVRETLSGVRSIADRPRVSLVVNLPSPRPGLPRDLEQRVRDCIEQQFPRAFERVSLMSLGHAGGLFALQTAQAMLADAPQAQCVVAAADSYLDPDMLEWLEETDQLHGAGERNNAWGFIPGEGAGALLLADDNATHRHPSPPLGRVRAIGLGREAELIRSGTVCLGIGLTLAVRAAFSALHGAERVTDVYCDMNGEPYRADEFAFLVTRTRERFVAPAEFVAPADCWGDVGAASGPLLVMLACIAGAKRYASGPSALVWASSVEGERAAALIDTGIA